LVYDNSMQDDDEALSQVLRTFREETPIVFKKETFMWDERRKIMVLEGGQLVPTRTSNYPWRVRHLNNHVLPGRCYLCDGDILDQQTKLLIVLSYKIRDLSAATRFILTTLVRVRRQLYRGKREGSLDPATGSVDLTMKSGARIRLAGSCALEP